VRVSEAKKRVADEGGFQGKEWLCTYEVMAYCSMSEGSLKTATKERGFPKPVKNGIRKNLYSRREIDLWMNRNFF
jgi:predicted DNA-binding transcriptional regulator AlpA